MNAIRNFLMGLLDQHGSIATISVDQFQQAGNVVLAESTLATEKGAAQVHQTLIYDDDEQILIDIPGLAGYWGR